MHALLPGCRAATALLLPCQLSLVPELLAQFRLEELRIVPCCLEPGQWRRWCQHPELRAPTQYQRALGAQ
jgi:hypothetical protein